MDLNKIVLPPPFEKVEETLSVDNESIPGEIKISQTGELLKNYFSFRGALDDLISIYDDWVFDKLPKQISSRYIEIDSEHKLYFNNPHIIPPMYSKGTQSYPMFPIIARSRKDTYSGLLTADLIIKKGDQIVDKKENVALGRIPIMLRSKLCYLYNKTPQELISMGECPGDPFGYFIIRGLEYVIMTQEKLRVNKIILFNKKKNNTPICRMTCFTIKGTSLIVLSMSETKGIRISLHFLKEKTISVFQIYRILGIKDIREIQEMVLLFTKDEWRNKVVYNLQPTVIEYLRVGDDAEDISEKIGNKMSNEEIRKKVIEELFPQMQNEPLKNRLWLLSIMVSRYTEYISGLRQLDDRDHWSNKRLESAGRLIEQLFGAIYNIRLLRDLSEIISKNKLKTADEIARRVNTEHITEGFVKAFNPKSWGVKGSFNKDNVAEQLKRESILSVYSQLMRINTPTSRQAKQFQIRMVQMSQLGFIDPVETPEGKNCGLVKHRSITCRYSLEIDDTVVRSYMDEYISPNYDKIKHYCSVILNGKFLGWCDGMELYEKLTSWKRSLEIHYETSIIYDADDKIIYVYTDGSRPIRPLLVVDKDSNELVIDKKKLWGKPFRELLENGAVEYVDPWEQEYIELSPSVDDLKKRKEFLEKLIVDSEKLKKEYLEKKDMVTKNLYENVQEKLKKAKKFYTHCELDPTAIFGISSSMMPLANHNQGPRLSYFCSMVKQALSQYHSNHQLRFDPTIKVLSWPTRPLFETQMSRILNVNQLPAGETVICAFMVYTGYNQEDALIFNKSSVDSGKFMYTVYFKYYVVLKSGEREFIEYFGISGDEKERKNEEKLDENGIVRLGTYVKQDDIIVRKIRIFKTEGKKQEVKFIDTRVARYQSGVVDQIIKCKNSENKDTIYIKIRDVRKPERGDKFASRYAQKATIGIILPVEDMPFVVEGRDAGVVPDIIINPHSIISRMTMGKMLEILSSKVAVWKGEKINATAFQKFDLDHFQRLLKQYGFDEHGTEVMRSGFTGEKIHAKIFMGPCYYQAMRHHTKDKIQMRSRGAVKAITHQPISGRNRGGGLRFGEMEKDNLISHGASALIQERLKFSSDVFQTVFCKKCGQIAISDITEGRIVCRKCFQEGSFGKCVIPYAFKTLLHYLAGAGIVMALRFKESKESHPEIAEVQREEIVSYTEEEIENP
jgi:DNA-directed RNA polymerase II subunit RPB2